MSVDFLITARALQAKGFCASGTRAWMRGYNMDYANFVRNGIMASELLATQDALAIRAVELLEAEHG